MTKITVWKNNSKCVLAEFQDLENAVSNIRDAILEDLETIRNDKSLNNLVNDAHFSLIKTGKIGFDVSIGYFQASYKFSISCSDSKTRNNLMKKLYKCKYQKS